VEVEVVVDRALAEALARVINAAYAIGEAGLWVEGTERVQPGQLAEPIADGELLAARAGDRVVGCARVEGLDEATAELGLVSVLPDQWGNGVGGALVRSAEERARELGAETMTLKVLSPIGPAHAQKELLRAWYERFGYRIAGREPFEAERLAQPCEFLVFRKPLR
jgi:GNAT superfamily N-acetyltransferase